jgi:putative transposase
LDAYSHGYRRFKALLKSSGWDVGKGRVNRIWCREGLKVPKKPRPRGLLWLNDGSCVRLRPERRNHVWNCDFVATQTHDGRSVRLITLIDEYTRECLAIRVARRINSFGVIEALSDVMIHRGIPNHIRQTQRGITQWPNLLQPEGGEGRDRKVAQALQHDRSGHFRY